MNLAKSLRGRPAAWHGAIALVVACSVALLGGHATAGPQSGGGAAVTELQDRTARVKLLGTQIGAPAHEGVSLAESGRLRTLADGMLQAMVDAARAEPAGSYGDRLIAAALNESDRMAAAGVTLSRVELALFRRLSDFHDPMPGIRLLERYLHAAKAREGQPKSLRSVSGNARMEALERLIITLRRAGLQERLLAACSDMVDARRDRAKGKPNAELAAALCQRAATLVALERQGEAERDYREAWVVTTALMEKLPPTQQLYMEAGPSLARLLLATGQGEEAAEVMATVVKGIGSEERTHTHAIDRRVLQEHILRSLGRTNEADEVWFALEPVIRYRSTVQPHRSPVYTAAPFVASGRYDLAEQACATRVAMVWARKGDIDDAVEAVRAIVDMADRSPEAAKAVEHELPVYRRWLERMEKRKEAASTGRAVGHSVAVAVGVGRDAARFSSGVDR